MDMIILLIRTLAVISIAMLIIYLYGMLIRRYRSKLMAWESWVAGIFFSVAAGLSILSARTLFEGSAVDGKLALLAVGTLFYGPRASCVIIFGILTTQALIQEPITLNILLQITVVMGIGLVYRKWLERKGYRNFYGPMMLLGVILVAVGATGNILFNVPVALSGKDFHDILLVLILAPAMTMSIGGVFLMEMDRRDKELDLIHTKEDLTTQNEEITALYEEMTAAEETLQEQYDQLQKNREELIRANDRYKLIYQASNEGLWEYDYKTKGTYLSDRITEIYGYGPEMKTFMNQERDSLIHPEDLPQVYENWRALNRGIIQSYDMEYRILHASGEYRWIQAKGTILRDENGRNLLMAGSHGDIHQRKIQEQKLYESAYYDQLTGLPNRGWFMETLDNCVRKTIATHDIGAVLIFGLDDFKIINETMGHSSGDDVLREVASRLAAMKSDSLQSARLNADKFLVLLSSIQQRFEIEAEIQRILGAIHEPIQLNEGQIMVTASLGAVLFPKDAHTPEMILRHGDMALQQAKSCNKNSYVFFDDKMAKENMRHARIDIGLKSAVVNQEFMLHYQPIFKTNSRELAGFEALVRWNSPEFGFVSPAEFIRLAEQNGTIVELGNWVLREACDFVNRMGLSDNRRMYLSINLSPVQLLQKDFVAHVKEIMGETGVAQSRIVFEITETAMMESFDASYQKILVLRDWGINFSLDDFGTGYSSLNYLRKIPVKTLKIDKSFIDDLVRDTRLQMMVKSIIDISHDLELTVVTEGVEEEAQLELLKSYGCDCIQGYLLGRPMPEPKAIELIQQ